jgi:hypothetical protein
VNVIVPARFTPPAEVTFVNRTPTVHEAPGASVVPVQVSAPATALKNQVRRLLPAPEETATPVTVADAPVAALPVFVNVTVPVPLRGLPPAANVIVSGFGVIDTVARVATPVPVKVTGVGVTVAPV